MRPQIAVGLDAGTTKISAIVAEVGPRGPRILGAGVSPSTGMRKGVVINMDSAAESFRKALKEAETSSGIRIRSGNVAISGAHIKGVNSCGAVGIRGTEVGKADRDSAIDSARAVYIPLDREVIHVIPTEFILDGQDGITDPAGMSGVRLEAKVHIITCALSSMQNLMRCCERAGLEVDDFVFGPVASAHSVLTRDERESGVALIDIGGGTTDIALFKDGAIRHAASLGIGGNHITNDIAVGLRINLQEAEELKKTAGSALERTLDDSAEIRIEQPGGEGQTLPRKYLASIIQPRCEEILELVRDELRRNFGYETAVCGAVVTGGAALLSGFDRISGIVLGLPVRTGSPINISGLDPAARSPIFATAIGLVSTEVGPETESTADAELFGSVAGKMKDWARGAFRFAENLKFYSGKS
jgi:cell division protein FtsA